MDDVWIRKTWKDLRENPCAAIAEASRNTFTAGNGNHPKTGFVLVGFEDGLVYGIGDPFGVGAQLRVMDRFDGEVVVNRDGPGGLSSSRRAEEAKRRDAEGAEGAETDGRQRA